MPDKYDHDPCLTPQSTVEAGTHNERPTSVTSANETSLAKEKKQTQLPFFALKNK